MAPRHGHSNVVQEGDEYVCRACWKRWDVADERTGGVPPCQPVENFSRNIGSYRTRTRKTFAGRYGIQTRR